MTKFITNKTISIEILSIGLSQWIPSSFSHLISLPKFPLTRSGVFSFVISKTLLVTSNILTLNQFIKLSELILNFSLYSFVVVSSSQRVTICLSISSSLFSGLLQFKLQLIESIINSTAFFRFFFQLPSKILFILLFLFNFPGHPHHNRFHLIFQNNIIFGDLLTFFCLFLLKGLTQVFIFHTFTLFLFELIIKILSLIHRLIYLIFQ